MAASANGRLTYQTLQRLWKVRPARMTAIYAFCLVGLAEVLAQQLNRYMHQVEGRHISKQVGCPVFYEGDPTMVGLGLVG
jgi:hypothetical protein